MSATDRSRQLAHAREARSVKRAEQRRLDDQKARVMAVIHREFPGVTDKDVILSYYDGYWIANVRHNGRRNFPAYRITIEEG